MGKKEDNKASNTSHHLGKLGQGASKFLGTIIGFFYFPLTMPFVYAAAEMQLIQEKNRFFWNKYKPNDSDSSPIHYISAALVVTGNSIGRTFLVPFKFILTIFASFWFGLRTGFKQGFSSVLTAPAYSFNRYYYNGEIVPNTMHFRSTHVLALGLIFTLLLCTIATILIFFFPWLFAPLAVLTKLTGINLATLVGVQATGLMLPLLNFTSLLILTLPLVYGLKAAVFSLITLGKATGECINGIINPESQGHKGNRFSFVFKRIISLIDKVLASFIGIPLYMITKPFYQCLDILRVIHRSNKRLWRNGILQSETRKTVPGEWAHKFGIVLLVLFNTLYRLLLAPFQLIGSILYAPLQAVRHAVKYGTTYVLSYPYQFANSYGGSLTEGDSNKKYIPNGKNYDNIHVEKYENVYYFKKRHIAVLAVLVGIALVVFSSLFPPLGFLSVDLTIKLLTPLGLAQISVSGAVFLLINFLTGVIVTPLMAVAFSLSSWFLFKLSHGLTIIKKIFSGSNHFYNLFHRTVTAGDALHLMKDENLAVKTIASKINPDAVKQNSEEKEIIKFGTSWVFNLDQFKNPSGVGAPECRPIYLEDDERRKYNKRHKSYQKYNPKTGVIETKKMAGARGRPKTWRYILSWLSFNLIPAYTKKTNVSLAPKDGMMAFFGGRDEPVGVAFDLTKLNTKGDKYVFLKDAWTNLKWWWEWKFSDAKYQQHVQPSTTTDGLRSFNRGQRLANAVPEHNDLYACLTKEALVAVVVSSKELSYRLNALFRKLVIKYELGIDLPILIMGTLNKHYVQNEAALPCQEYTVEKQLLDLFQLSKNSDSDNRSKTTFDALLTHYAVGKSKSDQEKSFVRALVNSHPINWATVFKKLPKADEATFKKYIKKATNLDLDIPTDSKPMPSHFTFAAA